MLKKEGRAGVGASGAPFAQKKGGLHRALLESAFHAAAARQAPAPILDLVSRPIPESAQSYVFATQKCRHDAGDLPMTVTGNNSPRIPAGSGYARAEIVSAA